MLMHRRWRRVFQSARTKFIGFGLGIASLATFQQSATAQSPYVLTVEQRQVYGGTFGINFSHYDFELDIENPTCQKLPGFNTRACSCTINWKKIREGGLEFAYLKATDGIKRDLAFSKNWDDLLAEHKAERVFRGAYHFLRPGRSAKEQAAAFLSAIGATNGRQPTQMSPVLDVEWAWEKYRPGSAEDRACPAGARDPDGNLRCDMWHTKTRQQIVDMAADWIDIVEKATDRQVTVYTNQDWWDSKIDRSGREIAHDQPIWISRYPKHSGPKFEADWDGRNGSAKWKMPPLPVGASYPKQSYTTPHFWQFSEEALIPVAAYTCQGSAKSKKAELNWVPVKGDALQDLLGVP